ncbi:MAG: MgtC/SapB family protein [Phototrophicales bacterium]|nr:MgtC/SapB family protein [Phototrophicales bacterium]
MDSVIQQVGEALAPIFGTFDPVLIGRLLLVLVLCGVIGLERSGHERASGFRPHILVGLGACLMTMAGAYAFPDNLSSDHDPMRVASYVVSGIGFLGAGAILRHGTMVRGLTTAATIWGASGIGIACGVGLGWLAVIVTLLVLFTLMILDDLEDRWGRNEATNELKIHLKDSNRAVGKALTALERLNVPIRNASVIMGAGSSAVLRVELSHPIKVDLVPLLVRQLLVVKSIQQVDTSKLQMSVEQIIPLPPNDTLPQKVATGEHPQFVDDNLLRDLNEPDEKNGNSHPKP